MAKADGRVMPCAGTSGHRNIGIPRASCPARLKAGAGKWLFISDDGGFTQAGTVIAMLLAISLMFTTAQAYWVSSESARIQDAADAGALAAANVVGEYVVVAKVADGVTLSMSLLGLSMLGVSIVAACIPGGQGIGAKLAQAANKVFEARNKFSESALKVLDSLQNVLPYLCVLNSAAVISENGSCSTSGSSYIGLALPIPLQGEDIEFPDDSAAESESSKIEGNDAEVEKSVQEADEALEEMNAAKLAGYMADCGASPSMRERAQRLASLSAYENPSYTSVDAWDFSVGIARATRYYSARASQESPRGSDIEQVANSVARGRFYAYALEKVSQGSVTTSSLGATVVDVDYLPANTADVKDTWLYTETCYPVSSDGVLHCSQSCPACADVARFASLSSIDSGLALKCGTCDYSIVTVGQVPQASTSISNGFEHHYRDFVSAAKDYTDASKRYAQQSKEAKDTTQESLDAFKQALSTFTGRRYAPKPPGRYGCIAVVLDYQTHEAPVQFGNFTGESVRIGPRAAISAAMLAPDEADVDDNVVSSLLARVADEADSNVGVRFADEVVELWGNLLMWYEKGVDGIVDGIADVLGVIPGSGGDALSSWAESALNDLLELSGLQPVKMASYKPVLVNSSHVMEKADENVAEGFETARSAYNALSADTMTLTISLSEWAGDIDIPIALPWGKDSQGGQAASWLQGVLGGSLSDSVSDEVSPWQ